MTETIEIEQCLVHMNDYDEDCEVCQQEVEMIRKQLMDVALANSKIEATLRDKYHVSIDMNSIMIIRLNTIIAVVFSGNEKMALKFENVFLTNCHEALTGAELEAIRNSLVNGVNFKQRSDAHTLFKGGH